MGEQNPGRRTFDPPRTVGVLHDDGRLYRGAQFEWVRWPSGEWRAGVTYSTGPGMRFTRSLPADRVIAPVGTGVPKPTHRIGREADRSGR